MANLQIDPIANIIEKLVSSKGLFVIAEDETIRLLKVQAGIIRDQNFFIELSKIASQKEENGDSLSAQDKRHLALVLTEYTGIERLISRIQRQNRNLIVIKPVAVSLAILVALAILFQITNVSGKIATMFPRGVTGSQFIAQGYAYMGLMVTAALVIVLAIMFKTIGNLAKHKLQAVMMDYNSTITAEENGGGINKTIVSAKTETNEKLSRLTAEEPTSS